MDATHLYACWLLQEIVAGLHVGGGWALRSAVASAAVVLVFGFTCLAWESDQLVGIRGRFRDVGDETSQVQVAPGPAGR